MEHQRHQQQISQLPEHADDIEEEQRRVELALQAVYSANSAKIPENTNWHQQRQLADRYLTSFQSLSQAWVICDRLLSHQSMETRFFAAQTLHRKCQTDVWQIPASSFPSLRDSLLNHLLQASSQTTLRTRLALSVAALALQMSWTTIVSDLATQLSSQDAVLAVLQVLPEECVSDRIVLEDEATRYIMRDHLISTAGKVLGHRDCDLWLTWIRYVPMRPEAILEAGIVPACLERLPEERAVDVVVEVLRLYPSHVKGNEPLAQSMWEMILALPLDNALNRSDEDMKLACCRIFTEMGESHLYRIYDEKAMQVVSSILRCSSIEDTSISSMTFQFWHRFVAELQQFGDLRRQQELVDLFTEPLLDLLDISMEHMQYPDQEVSPEEADEFHAERYYLAETVEDCCRLLGGGMVIGRVGQRLRNQYQNPNTSWQAIEATLYAMQPLAVFVPNDEENLLPYCFPMILQLPSSIEPLRFTASLFVGKYASWLSVHPNQLQPLLPYLAEGLSIAKCARAAARAIRQLCEVIPLGEPVLQLYQEVCEKIELVDELEILSGLCKGAKIEESAVYLSSLVQPIGNRLHAALHANPPTSAKNILCEVERLTVVVRLLPLEGQSVVEFMQSLWVLLETAGQSFPSDLNVAEKICRLHKHALRRAGCSAYSAMVPSLVSLVVQLFQRTHQSPYIYLASIIITEYPQYPGPLMEMLLALSEAVFSFLQNLPDMVSHPDVVEELFYCMGRMLKECPDQLFQATELTTAVIKCALLGMELQHKDANRGSLHFLERLVSHRPVRPDQRRYLEQMGPSIVQTAMRVCMGELPSYHLDGTNGTVTGVLYSLREASSVAFLHWANDALSGAPPKPQQAFLGLLQQEQSRQDFDFAVRSFHAACNRYRKLGGAVNQHAHNQLAYGDA